ncbi:hypothetical protein M4951_20830 [Blastopirellula sp. J2-11]|uniref:hypothetical protein n=1 Tax=Blastopirellula sp. J2-11 TaxID=2943192 RepID=UPI0021C688A8|nr:hypothetical protein [Blastopirellula sp. J2-11]UUO05803.1 hypothetical protein M4951_20830 [Blastopirellula sp. J2-11]
MSTICSNCGEELIGAVNRCWRCGREFEIDALADTPPVRRMSILPEYLHSTPTVANTATAQQESAEEEIIPAELVASSPTPLRLESPFRSADAASDRQRVIPWLPIALGTGGLGALLCLFTIAGVPLVLLAMGLIIWRSGLIPARQAWLLLLLAATLLLVASIRASVELHLYFFGQPLFPSLTL